MTTVYVMIGVPGSGKSTLAKKSRKRLVQRSSPRTKSVRSSWAMQTARKTETLFSALSSHVQRKQSGKAATLSLMRRMSPLRAVPGFSGTLRGLTTAALQLSSTSRQA